MSAPDVCIVWLTVHGGAFHKLITLHERLAKAGLSCEVLLSAGPPLGLKIGMDVPEDLLPELAARGIRFLPRAEALHRAKTTAARLLITDAHRDPDLPGLIAHARAQGVITAQMATLLGDFTCHGADHLLLQHPLTLFFELEFNRTAEAHRFFQAQSITFTGNIFMEPTRNQLYGGFGSREKFFEKYALDPRRPLCLLLPSAPDTKGQDYIRVIRAVQNSHYNLVAKLHPWEYAFKKHGPPHPWGLEQSSDTLWGIRAVDEPDTTWAYHYCNAAIIRASAMCMEMPFWKHPSLILPSDIKPALFDAQAALVASSSVRLPSVEALEQFLTAQDMPQFSGEDYARAQGATRLDLAHDAYELTVRAILDLLAGKRSERHSPKDIRRLYDSRVTPQLLRSIPSSRRWRAALNRWWRGIT